MRGGSYDYDGTTFRLHVQVIHQDSLEAREQIYLRDRLRADPNLVAEYVASKRGTLARMAEQVSEGAPNVAHNRGKQPFFGAPSMNWTRR